MTNEKQSNSEDFFYVEKQQKIPMELIDEVIKKMFEEMSETSELNMEEVIKRCHKEMEIFNSKLN